MGFPVMHSRSPKLHNYWLAQYGLTGTYLPLAIKADGLRAALRALPALGFSGCNLTIPHKEAALAMVDRVDPLARRIGAINCVVVAADGSLEGQNHDAFGYIESVREAQPGWRADAGPIVVIGAGGGARAVLVEPDRPGRARDSSGQSHARARAGAGAGLRRPGQGAAMGGAAGRARRRGHAGQHHQPGHGRRAAARSRARCACRSSALVSDIVYIPRETPLLAAARRRGNPTVNGLGMLLHQARPAFQAWFGIMPEVTPELRAMIEANDVSGD